MKIFLENLINLAFAGKLDVIVQKCNCSCRMENDLAGEIAQRIPEAVAVDNENKMAIAANLAYTVGRHAADSQHKFAVVNAYTQYEHRKEENKKSC